MKEELPKGWAIGRLGEICSSPQYGWTSKAAKNGRLRYLRTTDISSGRINWETVPFCDIEPEDKTKYLIKENDILVSRAGSVGISYRVSAVPYETLFASYLIRFRPLDGINPKIIESYLMSEDYWQSISDFTAGIAIPNVNASKLSDLVLPLPPLLEQHRIVAKLEKLLQKVDACKARLDKIPAILKRFRQSALADACSGRLTADWRTKNLVSEDGRSSCKQEPFVCHSEGGERLKNLGCEVLTAKGETLRFAQGDNMKKGAPRPPSSLAGEGWGEGEGLPEGWHSDDLESLIVDIQNGFSKRASSVGRETVVLRLADIVKQQVSSAKIRKIKMTTDEIKKYGLQKDDILVVRVNGSPQLVGNFILYDKSDRWTYCDHLIRMRVDDRKVAPTFLVYLSYSETVRDHINQNMVSSAGQNTISQTTIKSITVPLPPLPEQHEIVRRVEALFNKADEIEARYKKAKAFVDKLTQSILAKAFRGELVPQDPNDEPASVLLERIKAAKQKASKVSPIKGRRRGRYKIETDTMPMAAEEQAVYGRKARKRK